MKNKLDLFNISFFLTTSTAGIYGIINVTPKPQTLILATSTMVLFGLGITAGFHRLWAHQSYKAKWPLRLFLYLLGMGAMEGPCKQWCKDHRSHHKYVDTDKDPYNATRGLWWSHIGWVFSKPSVDVIKGQQDLDFSDLELDPVLKLDNIYPITSLTISYILPTIIAGYFWNDFYGGFFYAGIIRSILVHHMTFFINSLAHWKPMGKKTYNNKITPVDSPPLALLTLGEGYHNYHHTHPSDYRNGKMWYHLDPTKWFIWSTSIIGLSYNLKSQ